LRTGGDAFLCYRQSRSAPTGLPDLQRVAR